MPYENASARWAALCEEWDRVWAYYQKLQAALTRKFALVARGDFASNPSMEEISATEAAYERVEQARARMNKFVRENA
jgi:ABC-type uncharacterized transport system YnjBCD substrate-binding protein